MYNIYIYDTEAHTSDRKDMLKYINIRYFIISFFIGLLFVYISSPEFEYITIYPTKDNKHKFQFQDHGQNCFTLDSAEVECTPGAEQIPIQM